MTAIDTQWHTSPSDITFSPQTVHVWRVSLDQPPALVQSLQKLLSDEEAAKAARFRFEHDRRHYQVAHGVLRILLARYLRLDREQAKYISLQKGTHGKPALAQDTTLTFNLSHSRHLALFAFGHTRQIGVDVEYKRSDIEFESLVQRYFSPQEHAQIQALPLSLRQDAFFHCWTCKEAYIKAQGLGLSLPLNSFDVAVHPTESARLVACREGVEEAKRWQLCTLYPDSEYAAALAVEGHGWRLQCWQFDLA